MEVVFAAGAFVGLFAAFVVAPTMIQRRHEGRKDEAEDVRAGAELSTSGDH